MATLLSMFFKVPIRRSQSPDCCRLPGTLKRGVHPSIDKNVLVSWGLKFDATSDNITDSTMTSKQKRQEIENSCRTVLKRNYISHSD